MALGEGRQHRHRRVRLLTCFAVVVTVTAVAPTAASATVFTVSSNADTGGSCTTTSKCTLRQAIDDANTDPSPPSEIDFSLPPASTTISPASALPTLTQPVTINGTSQPGWAPGAPVVDLDGVSSGPPGNPAIGLDITAGTSVVEGLVIERFFSAIVLATTGGDQVLGNFIGTDVTGTLNRGNAGNGIEITSGDGDTIGGTSAVDRNVIAGSGPTSADGIEISGGTGHVIEGNFIGTDKTGTVGIGNARDGVDAGADDVTVGGAAAGAGNVIAANTVAGVRLSGGNNDVVQGNLIGVDATGARPLANSTEGVQLEATSNAVIGGATAADRNTISSNGGPGILIMSGATMTNVAGNFIGTDAGGTSAMGNAQEGIEVEGGSTSNLIGSTGTGNRIAFNGGPGVGVADSGSIGNEISGNSIFSNAGQGIDLGDDGVTPNDPMDADTGANDLQNFPVLGSVLASNSDLTVRGAFNSTPSKSYSLEFFANTACDASGNGQGQTFLGSSAVSTDGAGNAVYSVALPTPPSGQPVITATATDVAAGDTSEFSNCVTDQSPPSNPSPTPPPTNAGSPQADLSATDVQSPPKPTVGKDVTYTATVRNGGPSTATHLVMTDTLPSNTTFRSAPAGCSHLGRTVRCADASLAPGATRSFAIVAVPQDTRAETNVVTATSDQADPNRTNNGARTRTAAVLPAPILGQQVLVRPVSGIVLIRKRGTRTFVRLRGGEPIPVGSDVDATHGRVRLTSIKDRQGHTETADFYQGEFRIEQARSAHPITVLVLEGGPLTSCSARTQGPRLAIVARGRPRRRRRQLWGSGHGNFQTQGRDASASVRGTIWLTRDQCSGTLVVVRRGVVAVRDFRRHRTVRVRAGHRYLARGG